MRSLIKLSLASLAAVALFAGMAFAQVTPKLSGDVGAAFGLFSFGALDGGNTSKGKAYSEYTTSWESNLRVTVDPSDQVSARFRYRIRGNDAASGASIKTLCKAGTKGDTSACSGGYGASSTFADANAYASSNDDVFAEFYWKPVPALSIAMGKFEGQAWSAPISGTYLLQNRIGDGEYMFVWTGIPGIDIEYNAGVVQVGVAISDRCKPSCNAAAPGGVSKATVPTAVSIENTQTIVPHLTGKVGDIAFRAQLPSASGVINCGSAAGDPIADCKTAKDQPSQTGSGYSAGVQWAGMPGLSVALDLGSFTEGKNKSQTDDRVRSMTNVRVDFSGVTLGYFMLADNAYGKDPGHETTLTLRYTVQLGGGATLIPEYRSDSYDDKAGKAVDKNGKVATWNQSEFRLVGKATF